MVEEVTQHKKSQLKPKQGTFCKSGQSWTFLDLPQEGLIWQRWQNSRRLPSYICFQIKTMLEIKEWVSGSSPSPQDANSPSLLFLQGWSRPAGSKFAAWFKSQMTWPFLLAPCDRQLSSMSICKLVPASLASSSFQKKKMLLPAKCTVLGVELIVTGCCGGQGYKRIWREMRYVFSCAAFSGC